MSVKHIFKDSQPRFFSWRHSKVVLVLACTLALLLPTLGIGSDAALPNVPEVSLATTITKPLPIDTPTVSLATAPKSLTTTLQPPMGFEPNVGQTDPQVHFMARGTGYTVFLTPTKAILVLPAGNPEDNTSTSPATTLSPTKRVVQLQILGANPAVTITGQDKTPSMINRLMGSDPREWKTHVPVYAQVRYDEIYPGIDLFYYGNQHQLEYDFIVHPGAHPSDITLGIHGADRATVDDKGHLLLSVAGGTVRFQKPVLSQTVAGEIHTIAGRFILQEPDSTDSTAPPIRVAFAVGSYDPTLPLIIDPLVNYASALGGEGQDIGEAIAVDDAGHGFVVGTTDSFTFPVTANAFQDSASGPERDVFVTKFDTATSDILFSTYIGGEGNDRATGVAVDSTGIPYVTGETTSLTFPTQNPLQATLEGPSDAFVLKLATDGSSLLFSTYLGGSGPDVANGIIVDAQGQVSLTGATTSPDFPIMNAIDGRLGHDETTPQSDAFVSTLDAQGAALVFSTFLGGAGQDVGHSLTLDAAGRLYLTGEAAEGEGFPVTAGAFQATYGGGDTDAFIATINPAFSGSSALQYVSYLGGSGNEVGLDLLVDAQQQTFITGWTTGQGQTSAITSSRAVTVGEYGNSSPVMGNSTRGLRGLMRGLVQQQQASPPQPTPGSQLTILPEFPVTPNAYDATFNGDKDAFVAQVNVRASGPAALVYATYVGGSQSDTSIAIGLDSLGRLCMGGTTASPDFPVKNPLANQGTLLGGSDVFITKFEPDPSTLLFSSFLGGSGNEVLKGMRLDATNNAYLTGQTRSVDFPLLTPLDNTTLTGEPQAFLVKVQDPIDIRATLVPSDIYDTYLHLGEDYTWALNWDNAGPDPATEVQVTFEFAQAGLPASLQFKSIQNISGSSRIDINSCSGSALTGPGGTLTCDVADILVSGGNNSATLTFTPVTDDNYFISMEMVGREIDTMPGNNGNDVTGEIGNDQNILTITFTGDGTGRVEGRPGPLTDMFTIMDSAFIEYPQGIQTVTLSAFGTGLGSNASTFNEWSGDCAMISGNQCTVTMTADRTVSPSFNPPNQEPSVDAGPDQTITLPTEATLDGTVTDDGFPSSTSLTSSWSEVSGPGTVTFANAADVDTTASFSEPGTYILRLTADDGGLTNSDMVTIIALPIPRTLTVTQNPNGTITGTNINCGTDCTETVNNGTSITLTATPNPGFGFTSWTVSGTPSATCPEMDTCPITLDTNRTVTAIFTALINQPPVVEAGADQVIELPAGATLTGTVTDDGLPLPPALNTIWTLANGPGVITIANATATTTTATFTVPGNYVLQFTANDGEFSISDTATITIIDPTTALVPVLDVVGQTEADAITTLATVNLFLGTVTQELNDSVPAGTILRQSPPAGTSVNQSTPINVILSSGSKLVVTSLDDSPDITLGDERCGTGTSDCTLRAAIQEANTVPGEQTITLTPGIYTLTRPGANEDAAATGDLDITDAVIIESSTGNATEVIIAGNGLDRVFDLPPGSSPTVTLRNLTIQGGMVVGSTGGGIRNTQGTLLIEDSVVTENQSNGSGGGLSNLGGTLTLRSTQVTNNTSQGLGGGVQAQSGTVTIDGNTQFRSNSANFGGGLSIGRANVTVTNTLLENNAAVGAGGGIYKFLSPSDLLGGSPTFELRLSSTTIRNNTPDNCVGNGC